MSIIFSTQADLQITNGINTFLDQFGVSTGILGLNDASNKLNQTGTPDIQALRNFADGILNKLKGKKARSYDPTFVGSGKQMVVGSDTGTSTSPLEEPSQRTYYTQTPNYSIIVKKRSFSGLRDLYKPELMSPAEEWLLRSIKRLTARKCAMMADYEKLTKISKMADLGTSPAVILNSLLSVTALGFGNQFIEDFNTLSDLEKLALDRQMAKTSTYYIDPSIPIINGLGVGSGVFEITTISSLSTNLSIEGSGNCTFTIEDPYQLLIVTEADIEASLLETSLGNFVSALNKVASDLLTQSQKLDYDLNEMRKERRVSPISFSLVVGKSTIATLDSIGFEVKKESVNDIPENHALDQRELEVFKRIMTGLDRVSSELMASMRIGTLNIENAEIKENMDYARKKLRLYHLGKSIISVMDSVSVFIDGGTRRYGEGTETTIGENNVFTLADTIKHTAENLFNFDNQVQYDADLIKQEYLKIESTTSLSFEQYLQVRMLDLSGNGNGIHVFGGFVNGVSDLYDASNGKFTLNINCVSNMEWLGLSRYNASPSLDKADGHVNDPLTPFIIGVDPATGLPTGEIKLTPENEKRIKDYNLHFDYGDGVGSKLSNMEDMNQDVRVLGQNLIPIFQHAPGLLYRWKEGIQTSTYNMQTIDPKSKTLVDKRQLYRDIGQYNSNTPFDNMDGANIISVMVTGQPYNYTTFLQSALQTGSYIPDVTLNKGNDYFHTFLDVTRSINKVQGNFVPFKSLTVSPEEAVLPLAQALNAQRNLSGFSTKLSQLRMQVAQIEDKIRFLNKAEIVDIADALRTKKARLEEEITELQKSFNDAIKDTPDGGENAVLVAGNDVAFVYETINNDKDFKVLGDRLIFESMKKREHVIYNRDKNYLIITDDYDKDYDIQAFVQNLRQQNPNLLQSTLQPVIQLCREVAKILNFEFFTDTQGNLVFRPPQYNRTPLSVLEGMFLLNRTSGIKLFPDFILSLFKKREESILRDIIALEWEIKLNGALLGATDDIEVVKLLSKHQAGDLFFLSSRDDTEKAIVKDIALTPEQRLQIQKDVGKISGQAKINKSNQTGSFSSIAQLNLQKTITSQAEASLNALGSVFQSEKKYYEKALNKLISITGQSRSNFGEFDKVKIGAVRNGNSTPSTDISNIISKISNLISRRSGLLRALDKTLQQNVQIGKVGEDGNVSFSGRNFARPNKLFGEELTGIASKLIEDTRKDILGHLSGQRFIIKDEHILRQQFEEHPPQITNINVIGSEPLLGTTGGNLAEMPQYIAHGVDFDMWRQYGWRGEMDYNVPYFWSVENQCAPYAVMELSRQRKDIVKGNITVIGNEFYQLGDVVYVVGRQLLYYVNSINHSINYDGNFTTTLDLRYGHPPGEYIPTPLDIIGKSLTSRSGSQTSFRTKRQVPITDTGIKAVLKFPNGVPTINNLLSGTYGARNYQELVNVSIASKKEFGNDPKTTPRLYIISFTDDPDAETRVKVVASWFSNPQKPISGGVGTGMSGVGSILGGAVGGGVGTLGAGLGAGVTGGALKGIIGGQSKSLGNYKIASSYIKTQVIRQHIKNKQSKINYNKTELELLSLGVVASDEAYRLTDTELDVPLKDIVEVRLRLPPSGGWVD